MCRAITLFVNGVARNMPLGERLRELRLARNLTQAELARQLYVSPSIISMYEKDQRKPSFEQEEILADYFNVDLNFLRGNTDTTTEIVSADIHVLIQIYKRLSPEHQFLVMGYARGIMDLQQQLDNGLRCSQDPESVPEIKREPRL